MRIQSERCNWVDVDSLVEDHLAEINKLVKEGLVFLTDLINDMPLIKPRWIVVEGRDGAGPLELVQTQAVASLPPFSSNNNEGGEMREEINNEEVNITRDLEGSRMGGRP